MTAPCPLADWAPLSAFPTAMRTSLRWLLRHADENGIVEAGVALKFGRAWLINTGRLPEFLQQQTLLQRQRQHTGGAAHQTTSDR